MARVNAIGKFLVFQLGAVSDSFGAAWGELGLLLGRFYFGMASPAGSRSPVPTETGMGSKCFFVFLRRLSKPDRLKPILLEAQDLCGLVAGRGFAGARVSQECSGCGDCG